MKDIDIIIPVHEYNQIVEELTENAINSVIEAQKHYSDGVLRCLIVYSKDIEGTNIVNDMKFYAGDKIEVNFIKNDGDSDFCSQVNFAVDHVKTDYFSILEFDDEYTAKWFKMAHEYYFGNESISIFMPVNLFHDSEDRWEYFNTMALSPAFITSDANDDDEIGIINRKRLEDCSVFNLTGSIINTKDFIRCGKYKPSIKLAFNYELMLRMCEKGCKMMVVPKEGYIHMMGRKGSLTDEYMNTTTADEREKWFALALRECVYDEDRKKDVSNVKEENLK